MNLNVDISLLIGYLYNTLDKGDQEAVKRMLMVDEELFSLVLELLLLAIQHEMSQEELLKYIKQCQEVEFNLPI